MFIMAEAPKKTMLEEARKRRRESGQAKDQTGLFSPGGAGQATKTMQSYTFHPAGCVVSMPEVPFSTPQVSE